MSQLKPVADPAFLSIFLTEDIYLTQDVATSDNVTQEANTSEIAQNTEPPIIPASINLNAEASAIPEDLIFGKNNKGLLILVHAKGHKVLDKAEGKLLKDILGSVNYTFDDVAILNTARCTKSHYWQSLDKVRYSHVLSFGQCPAQLKALATATKYSIQNEGGIAYILVDELAIINSSRDTKIQLWNLLKRVFV